MNDRLWQPPGWTKLPLMYFHIGSFQALIAHVALKIGQQYIKSRMKTTSTKFVYLYNISRVNGDSGKPSQVRPRYYR